MAWERGTRNTAARSVLEGVGSELDAGEGESSTRLVRDARVAGVSEATLDGVRRRRSQLSLLLLLVLVGLCAATAAVPTGVAPPVSPNALRFGVIGLSATFAAYAIEKERALRRLEQVLRDEHESVMQVAQVSERMARLVQVGEAVMASLDPERVAEAGLDGALSLLESEAGTIFFERGDLIPTAQRGNLRFDQEDARRVRDSGGHAVTVAEGPGGAVTLAAPLHHEGTPLGVLAVASSPQGVKSKADLLAAYAKHVSIALANARSYRAERVVNEQFGGLQDAKREFDWLVVTPPRSAPAGDRGRETRNP